MNPQRFDEGVWYQALYVTVGGSTAEGLLRYMAGNPNMGHWSRSPNAGEELAENVPREWVRMFLIVDGKKLAEVPLAKEED